MLYSPVRMKLILRLYSLISQFVSALKNLFYDWRIFRPARASLPVISVGNISLGGTGKTPLAIEIMAWLAERGRRPALVSRGYLGRWEKFGGVVSDGRLPSATWRDAGDEPLMVAKALPGAGVFVGKNRLASCARARELGFDIAVLDDGFQHRRLARDFDIAVYSPSEKAALRESTVGLKRADVILVEKGEIADSPDNGIPPGLAGACLTYEVAPRGFHPAFAEGSVPVEDLRGRPLLAFCGIARPERFLRLLESQDIRLVTFLTFPDHFRYPRASIAKILRAARAGGAAAALTTAKDAVKLADWSGLAADIPLFVLEIALAVDPRFFRRLEAVLGRFPKP